MSHLPPSFMIIGERKCGTSSLYRYLLAHPEVLPCQQKETAFFSNSSYYINRHLHEYLSCFPDVNKNQAILNWVELDKNGQLSREEIVYKINPDTNYITGEASANVLSTVHPRKIKRHFPEMKFVVMMRNPAKRAISHHKMFVRFKKEGRGWSSLVGSANRDIKIEMMLLKLGIPGPYIAPGHYLQNIKKWLQYFTKEQFFFLITEEMESLTQANSKLQALCDFLEISPFDFESILNEKYNESPSAPCDQELLTVLKKYYKTPNMELERFLNTHLIWNHGV